VGERETAGRCPGLSWAAPFGAEDQRLSVAAGTSLARTASYKYDSQGKRWKTTTPEGSMSTNSIPDGGLISSSGTHHEDDSSAESRVGDHHAYVACLHVLEG
jgi:hypothetical protein